MIKQSLSFPSKRIGVLWLIVLAIFTVPDANFALDNDASVGESDRSLLISDGSRFVPKDFYPKFSWETTPRYFMFGDKNRVLRPEQVRFIAERTGFLVPDYRVESGLC
jgi:hypothetical protein